MISILRSRRGKGALTGRPHRASAHTHGVVRDFGRRAAQRSDKCPNRPAARCTWRRTSTVCNLSREEATSQLLAASAHPGSAFTSGAGIDNSRSTTSFPPPPDIHQSLQICSSALPTGRSSDSAAWSSCPTPLQRTELEQPVVTGRQRLLVSLRRCRLQNTDARDAEALPHDC